MSPLNVGAARGIITSPRNIITSTTDPYFSNVSLLLHLNGSDASTTFTDSSSANRTVNKTGNARIVTSNSKFGGSSGFLDGINSALYVSYTSALDLILSDFTIETWIYQTSGSDSGKRIAAIGGGSESFNSTNGIHFVFQSVGTVNPYLQLQWWNGSTAAGFNSSDTFSLNQWTHVCVSKSGNKISIGTSGQVKTSSDGVFARPSTNPNFGIGYIPGGAFGFFPGYMDEFRVTKDVARYTSNYTVPTTAFFDS